MKKLLITLSLAATAICQADPVQISITGTADTTGMGYTSGQSYTFNWVVSDGYTGSTGDSFSPGFNEWEAIYTSHPLLWTSVSGDGLSGTYSRPSGNGSAPSDLIRANSIGLLLLAGNDDLAGSSMGLTVDGTEVYEVSASGLDIPALDYSDLSFVNPADWLGNYAGTHALSSGSMAVFGEPDEKQFFTATSATITTIPEPASLGLLGLVSGGIFFTRRFFTV